MDMTAWSFAAFFVSFLLWAFTGTYLSITLRESWPALYAQSGSPTAKDFWWRRAFPNSFDKFTMTREGLNKSLGTRRGTRSFRRNSFGEA
jgi:hypothetical protein